MKAWIYGNLHTSGYHSIGSVVVVSDHVLENDIDLIYIEDNIDPKCDALLTRSTRDFTHNALQDWWVADYVFVDSSKNLLEEPKWREFDQKVEMGDKLNRYEILKSHKDIGNNSPFYITPV